MSVRLKIDLGELEDFRSRILRLPLFMQKRVHEALEQIAGEIREEARRRVPVRTGFLRSTIYTQMGPFAEFGTGQRRWQIEVGAWAQYAKYVEFGTQFMEAQPYLTVAFASQMRRISEVMKYALDKAAEEFG